MIITGNAAEVAAAYVKARSEMQTTIKNDAKGVYNNYPTLRKVIDTIMPFLNSHQLTFNQEPLSNETGVGVATSIVHASGGIIEFGTLIMPVADRKPQTVGSAITYAKRYALTSIFGLVGSDDDDDGQAAQDSYKAKPKPVQKPDDSMWEPTEKPKRHDKVSQAQLSRLHIVGLELYGKDEWEDQRPKLVLAVSTGEATSSKELTPEEADRLIKGIEKRIAEAKSKQSNGHVKVAA